VFLVGTLVLTLAAIRDVNTDDDVIRKGRATLTPADTSDNVPQGQAFGVNSLFMSVSLVLPGSPIEALTRKLTGTPMILT